MEGSFDKFKKTLDEIEASLDDVRQVDAAEKKRLKRKSYSTLASNLESVLEQGRQLIQEQALQKSDTIAENVDLKGTVKINVGGSTFEVEKSVIFKEPTCLLAKIFSGKFPFALKKDSIFIDRDPTHFPAILSYLQSSTFTTPDSEDSREQLLKDAHFYKISSLIPLLTTRKIRDKNLGPINIKIRDDENRIRDLFLSETPTEPYLHLIDVFSNFETFQFDNSESEIPVIMEAFRNKNLKSNGPSIVDQAKFKENFVAMAPHLSNIDWNGVFIAGGSILACLLPSDDKQAFQYSDIDLFLYGFDAHDALNKIKQIYESIKSFGKVIVVRTKRTMTFVCGYPYRHVQVVLRLYSSPAEVLLGFDLDCVGVGYDGNKVWALPRARRALNCRYNIADPSRQTYRTNSYEYRLWKYSRRGFGVAVPGFKRAYVNSEIYKREYSELSGFAKLLFLETRDLYIDAYRFSRDGAKDFSWNKHGMRQMNDPLTDDSKPYVDTLVTINDYNCGVLIPFNPTIDLDCLKYHLDYCSKKMTFIFSYDLEQVLDVHKSEEFHDVKIPRFVEFIGSLKEYIVSLPNVEEDWYRGAMLPFPFPKIL